MIMSKLNLAKEFYSCVKNGWNVVNRDGEKLAYITKKTNSNKTQQLIENGYRRLLNNHDEVILSRNPNGKVTSFDHDLMHEFTWTKNPETKKYGWYNKALDIWKNKLHNDYKF